jgi:hypothetical protein
MRFRQMELRQTRRIVSNSDDTSVALCKDRAKSICDPLSEIITYLVTFMKMKDGQVSVG